MRVEVRCCCQPQKLLGWMSMPDKPLHVGDRISFIIPRPPRVSLTPAFEFPLAYKLDVVDLTVARYVAPTFYPDNWLAFKSDDIPIERLRMLREFTEVAA